MVVVEPVLIASPEPVAYRWHPGHRSATTAVSISILNDSYNSHLRKRLCLGDQLVSVLGEVLLGLQEAAVGHDDDEGGRWFQPAVHKESEVNK